MKQLFISLCLLSLLGCDPDFPDRSLVDGYRVLGVKADPASVGPSDEFTLSVIETTTPNVVYTWSVCLVPLGGQFGFECLDDIFDIPLSIDGPTAIIDLGPEGIDLIGALSAGFQQFISEQDIDQDEFGCGEACSTRDGESVPYTDIQFNITSGPPEGRTVSTVKLMRIYFDDSERNSNPEILSFEVESQGPFRGGDIVTFNYTVNDALFQSYTLINGTELIEENIMTWYTTAGEFTDDPSEKDKTRNISTSKETNMYLRLPKAVSEDSVEVWGILRDERGGTDFRTLSINIEP